MFRCDLAWSKDYPLPYRLNFTDKRRFEIGCMVVIYVRLQEGTMINLIDENGDVNFHVVVHWWSIILNSRFRGAWGQQVVFCEEVVVHPDCVNHGDEFKKSPNFTVVEITQTLLFGVQDEPKNRPPDQVGGRGAPVSTM
uniref:MATH domain-containing protein n=1 Tax=Bursaphelenchus xylophilus TaxID=6326 RepID=A0A1I7S7R7_BURXY